MMAFRQIAAAPSMRGTGGAGGTRSRHLAAGMRQHQRAMAALGAAALQSSATRPALARSANGRGRSPQPTHHEAFRAVGPADSGRPGASTS